ncbi:MAG: sensor histidine kinase [Flavobacteriales bacterium]|nr:sensor histidine kinase [Flavobacteriales bacterium]MBS4040007.1 sensor histidine kinase [Flavobacteriales bacterium]
MRHILFWLVFSCGILLAQSSKELQQIDSLNQLAYPVKISNAKQLLPIYLKNLEKINSNKQWQRNASTLENISLLYYYIGNYEESAKAVLTATRIYQQKKEYSKLAHAYANFGYQLKRKDLNKGFFYMRKAMYLIQKYSVNNPSPIIDNYGVLHEMNQVLDSATYYYQKALDIKRKEKDSIGIPYSLHKLAGVEVMKKNFSSALPKITEAIQIRLSIKDSTGLAESYDFYGDYYRAQKKWNEAQLYYLQSNALAQKFSFPHLVQATFQKIAEVLAEKKQFESALSYFQQHTKIKDSILNVQSNLQVAALEVAYNTEQKERKILEQRAMLAEKNTTIILVLSLLLLSVLTGYFLWNKHKIKAEQWLQEKKLQEAILQIETQKQLQEQRLKISRDLHDNIGAQLTFIISSIDNLKMFVPEVDERILYKMDEISTFTRQTITELRDTIWAMNQDQISLQEIQSRLTNFISQANQSTNKTQVTLSVLSEINLKASMSSDKGISLYRIIQEAINNAFKHAMATQINVSISQSENQLIITISDDGKGLDWNTLHKGNGIENMQKRAKHIHGLITFESSSLGTTIQLKMLLQ